MHASGKMPEKSDYLPETPVVCFSKPAELPFSAGIRIFPILTGDKKSGSVNCIRNLTTQAENF